MSLYNLICGFNGACLLVMPMLGRKKDDYPRFRDCFFGCASDGTREIHIFTRVGSSNQNYGMGEEELYKDPNYLRFEDEPDDSTYGTYIFKCPAQWEADFDRIREGKLSELSSAYYEMQRAYWGENAEAVIAKIKEAAKDDQDQVSPEREVK